MKRRKPFTLVEIVVVIVIMVVTAGLVVRAIRNESTTQLIKRTTTEFETLCGRVRSAAIQNSEDRCLVYDPADNYFYMANPNNVEDDGSYEILNYIKWRLPDDFELDTKGENDVLEVFRFFADGGSSAVRNFTVTCRQRVYTFSVSALTSQVTITEETQNSIKL